MSFKVLLVFAVVLALGSVLEGARLRAPPACKFETDVDFEGNDLPDGKSTVDFVSLCKQACTSSADCKFFTYEEASKTCQLKTSDSGRKAKPGFTSGAKECAKPAATGDTTEAPATSTSK